jgi:hypothetical protein
MFNPFIIKLIIVLLQLSVTSMEKESGESLAVLSHCVKECFTGSAWNGEETRSLNEIGMSQKTRIGDRMPLIHILESPLTKESMQKDLKCPDGEASQRLGQGQ